MDPISVNVLNIIGRVTERDKQQGNVFAVYNADWSTPNAYAFQFGVQSQGQTFGVVKSLKVDNGSNPENVEVAISGTDDFFTIPSFSIGVYTLNANAGSTVTLTSQGGASELCTVTFYNYEVPPVVWYSFGAFNSDRPIRAQGSMDEGDTVASEEFNKPIFIGGIDRATGEFRGIGVDALGRLDFSSTINVGGVFGADPMGAAPINPGFAQAVLDSTGDLVYVTLNAAGEFEVHDADVLAKLVQVETLVTATNVKLDALVENTDKATTGTQSIVVAAATDTIILASNAARQGATVFNDSTAVLYLLLANDVSSVTVYSVQIAAGGYYEVPAKYSGIIKGIWSAANGNARVTELV